jgi:dihydrofolate reductase
MEPNTTSTKGPRVSMISAIAKEDRAIGFKNQLLWHLPEDLKHFKETTFGHPVIMGENTFLSLGRPLPGRANIVLTLDMGKTFAGAEVAHDLQDALTLAAKHDDQEVFVIGGGVIYKAMLPFVKRLYLTLVPGIYEADTFFPEYSDFTKVVEERRQETALGTITFLTLERE